MHAARPPLPSKVSAGNAGGAGGQGAPLGPRFVAAAFLLVAGITFADDPPGVITTYAGGAVGDGGPATAAPLDLSDALASKLAVDSAGNLYIADHGHARIRKVAPDGTITTIAGTGAAGFSGDGGPATAATIHLVRAVAVDAAGSVFISDSGNHRIRKIAPDGTITTVAGTGATGFSGDGGPATSARLWNPFGIAFDGAGNLLIADSNNHRIRKVAPGGTISTVAGAAGSIRFSGDGGPATSATLNLPADVTVDASGVIFIADRNNHRIRKVATDGTISTIAGTGTTGPVGDGGPAISASLHTPMGVAADGAGNVYIAEYGRSRIRRIGTSGIISTVAGTGVAGFAGDGGPATAARLNEPQGVIVDAAGALLVVDGTNERIRKVAATGEISTVAGNGTRSYCGDGGPATAAALDWPWGVAVDGGGNLYIADTFNHRVRRVAADGTISTVAGTGALGSSGDGGSALLAKLWRPEGVAVDAAGVLYIADTQNHRVRRVAPDGTIATVAGSGATFSSGDGGPATSAGVRQPAGLIFDAAGNLLIAEAGGHRIRKVTLAGTITTVAGTGVNGYSGDGGPATSARLGSPANLAIDAAGNLFIADRGNNRIRRVSPGGTISTVAGTGTAGYSGDGGPALLARLWSPYGVALDAAGNLLIADTANYRVRRVTPDGVISTIVGNGTLGSTGDGGPATSASLRSPAALAVDSQGRLFIAEYFYGAIRMVAGSASAASIAAPSAIVQECDDAEGEGSTVHFVFDVVPGTADLLRVTDLTGSRTLLEVSNPSAQQYGIGPVVFPHGASTVSIRLLAGATEVASATVTVQIEDTLAPVLLGCEAKTIELEGPLTALNPALLGITAEDACDPVPAVSFAPASLALGTTTVTATARDVTGNTSESTFAVTVVDTTPPLFLVQPQDLERHCEGAETVVAFDVLAEDLSGSVTILCKDEADRTVDPSGTPFAVGEHTVTCTATDGSGNAATCAFLVTIVDDEAPVLVVPADIVVGTDPGVSYAFVAFAVTATDECDPSATISCAAPWGAVESGDAFPLGSTTVVCTARDHAGNEASVSFSITVEDREPPVIAAPASVTLTTDCAGSALAVTAATLGATATDNCDPEPSLLAAPASLLPGTTAVVVTSTDEDGNASQATVQVTVLQGPFEVRFLRPLDGNVDNVIQPGRTVPVKIRVSCENLFEAGATAAIERVERLDGTGTPVANELVDDAGLSSDDGALLRLDAAAEQYLYNLSTKGWATTSGTRFRVLVRVSKAGHADTFANVVLKNR